MVRICELDDYCMYVGDFEETLARINIIPYNSWFFGSKKHGYIMTYKICKAFKGEYDLLQEIR